MKVEVVLIIEVGRFWPQPVNSCEFNSRSGRRGHILFVQSEPLALSGYAEGQNGYN